MTPAEGVDNLRRLRAPIEELSRATATLAVFQPAAMVRRYRRGPSAGGRRIEPDWQNVAGGFSQR